ncbi:ABC-three component system middle component 6 [Clostridium chauvoei]|uniref:Uncharacterized protein n=2 Tax=Clostridium chauvoei TaxID=46867 RepID=A0A1U6JHE9_9CLOT|nr:ABC-three component system middle component 6 [Clostridium chauvoei]ATD55432.1 hypothetical protein BTM20_09360 [Clostridium chauvoei]ATD56896.1 hypothetical protein BTM21_03680 [Clostridium chauvoei]MBX7280734.1 hypothetical protein [Clostridium chauvoei]MBX7283217.1 hypothetical protein [Clostridium chauvoei]MBX7285898.1 hypothetical protein [Clostridium chauvoei]
MIMPKKHITLSESYIGFGAFVLDMLKEPLTIDDCWNKIQKKYIDKGLISKKHSFDSLILTVDLLFALNTVDINERGEIYNVYKKTNS